MGNSCLLYTLLPRVINTEEMMLKGNKKVPVSLELPVVVCDKDNIHIQEMCTVTESFLTPVVRVLMSQLHVSR